MKNWRGRAARRTTDGGAPD